MKPQLQQSIQTVYKRIKKYNKYVNSISEIPPSYANESLKILDIEKQNARYLVWLDSTGDKLKEDIPIIMEKLEQFRNI
ncbi:hypothetical protein CENSYa_0947 [Cenarchaeum symbiosum A]|uniref:Uncharacterized protein n=1 Tax=Cenarchaeum symbiosum (strain A) TaxID=414004 RepID=A0RW62_CENSY|nr:hypothetical protein CENSYa_0947 [Cenarchaeum symbiosum A]